MHILITGASGSGTTTLASTLAQELKYGHIDADDFYWLPTAVPYQQKRPHKERLESIVSAQQSFDNSIISGSVMNWGLELENSFDLIVFLYLDAAIRVERLKTRELQELGKIDQEFLDWAAHYDDGPSSGRSLTKHNTWLSERHCPVIRIEHDCTVQERCLIVQEFIESEMTDSKASRAT